MNEIRILSEKDKELVHEQSLKILEETGVRMESKATLSMLESKGCIVDREAENVKFPPALVEKALETAPEKFILGGLDPKNDMFLGEGNTYVATDGQSCFVVDTETGERRESVLKDLMEAAQIADSLDYINCFWPIVSACDLPEEIRTMKELCEGWKVTGKHFQTDCFSAGQAKYYMKLLDAILGSREKVIERKIFSTVCCPLSPLSFDPEMLEGCLALCEIQAPVVVLPMPISGTTAPMTLLGTVIQNNVEVLAGLTVFQLQTPGTPVIYGSAPGILDMKTTMFCVGSPEGMLQNAASCEMAKFYKLPSLISTSCTDAKEPDIQCGREKTANALPAYMTRPDIFCGVGLADTSNLYYPELLILDEDTVGYAKRIADGINGGLENTLTDVVMEVGPGGDFLGQKSTRKHLRSGEQYHPTTTQRQSYESWVDSKEGNIRQVARKKVEEILSQEPKRYLPEEISTKLDAILAEAEKELCQES